MPSFIFLLYNIHGNGNANLESCADTDVGFDMGPAINRDKWYRYQLFVHLQAVLSNKTFAPRVYTKRLRYPGLVFGAGRLKQTATGSYVASMCAASRSGPCQPQWQQQQHQDLVARRLRRGGQGAFVSMQAPCLSASPGRWLFGSPWATLKWSATEIASSMRWAATTKRTALP